VLLTCVFAVITGKFCRLSLLCVSRNPKPIAVLKGAAYLGVASVLVVLGARRQYFVLIDMPVNSDYAA
jgi:hypothetical protein